VVLVLGYFVAGLVAMYAWVVRTKGQEFMQRWGAARFGITAFLFLNMVAVIIKMGLRLGMNVKYILVTPSCFEVASLEQAPGALAWERSSEEYPAIGTVQYQHAPLAGVRKTIPDPAPRPSPVIETGRHSVAVEIDAPMLPVYQLVIDLDQRPRWLSAVERVDRPATTERIGLRHTCIFHGLTVEWRSVKSEIGDDEITYVEDGRIIDKDLPARASFVLKRLGERKTSLQFSAKWLSDPEPPREMTNAVLADYKLGLEAIKTLCEAGLKVCAINAGRRLDPNKDFRHHRKPWDMKFRGFGDPAKRAESYGYMDNEWVEGVWEHEIPFTTAPGTRWMWPRCFAVGGKTNFWGRSSARMGDIDFRAGSLSGAGIDWPLEYREIAPFYSRVERMIGVASTVQNRPSNPDGEYLPAFNFRCLDHILQQGGQKVGIPYLPDRIAQLTRSLEGSPPCHFCGACTTGCDTGSFFSTPWRFLPRAEATGNLDLRTNALAKNVLVDENGLASGTVDVRSPSSDAMSGV